ncbi:MAG TPA: glucosyl transferase [Ignavibacteria bacterium]|nr:glucosyl transferase [Ignavibacteria bacterium]
MNIKTKLFLLLLLFTFSMFPSCSSPTQPPTINYITLSLKEASSTEAWVNLKVRNVSFPAQIILVMDNKALTDINLTSNDTTVYIDSLQPNGSYWFVAQFTQNNETVTSNLITVQTLDTTSNNFTWQTFTFGDPRAGSSTLNDVAIINENDIWAVGEIHTKETDRWNVDSTKWILPYNAVHWDGKKWKLKRILYNYQGQAFYHPIQSVFAFNSNDIWFGGNGIIRWDGLKFIEVLTPKIVWGPHLINKIWGTSNNDLYIVGNGGKIAHYLNGVWSKIESGTTTNLNDIWGYYDKENNKETVLTVASNILHHGEYRLLAISGNTAHDTLNWPYNNWLKGIWFQGKYSPVYICGVGIRKYENGKWSVLNLPPYFTEAIRGTGVNDITAVGDYGFVAHYNGVRWYTVNLSSGYLFSSVSVKNNIVAISGNSSSGGIVGKAIVIIGRH